MTENPNKAIHYPQADPNPDFVKIEERVLDFWKRERVFERSVEGRAGAEEFIFYDGPPFANGLPHYGHLLTSCVKDIFARYQTMRGKRVERRFGWDCHGLPAEMEAEKELKVSGRKAIEDYGIAKFNEHCRTSVMKYTEVWQQYVNRAARWVDFENDYKTMDTSYMESVLWAFKQLYDKGLLYESARVMPYSWAAQTPLSNFEIRMDDAYRDRVDKAVTVGFELNKIPDDAMESLGKVYGSFNIPFLKCYILAWTTTPWTLPSNLALAVSTKLQYRVIHKNDALYIASNGYVEQNGAELKKLGFSVNFPDDYILYVTPKDNWFKPLSYEPLFPYFAEKKNEWPRAFTILDGGSFIEEGSGTGVVHLAPGFGEDDQRVCAEAGIEVVCPVDEAGRYTDEIYDIELSGAGFLVSGKETAETRKLKPETLSLKGLNVVKQMTGQREDEPYKPEQLEKYGLANLRIIDWLKRTEKLVKQEDYVHSYPHCWRTDQPIIYMAVPSWYVEVTKFRDRMVALNHANINWVPEHIRDGQFGKWLENARDWSISRNRFWGTPIPVWKNEKGDVKVFGSIAELEAFFGTKVEDLHRPFIDELVKTDASGTWRRVTDVFDCWFESGSMPFAQVHYPFENREWFETHFPGDFIVEYVGQTRGWFYTLMVLATALFDCVPFKNCICHGIILDAQGKKLSKKLRNYPDPFDMFNTYGADAMRWRMVSEPIMQGGNLLISKDGSDIRDMVRLIIKPIWNAYSFFCMYANADGIRGKWRAASGENLMDRYILAKCRVAVEATQTAMDAYDTPTACKAIEGFFEVLNNWYIRRSKERFWRTEHDADKQAAYDTLFTVLSVMLRVSAPLMPLVTEEIYRGLSGEESVHLADWPDVGDFAQEVALVADMDRVRDACNAILSIRNAENIRVRQPLARATLYGAGLGRLKAHEEIIRDEVNVKEVTFAESLEQAATLKLTVNFPVAGKRLGAKMKEVAAAAKRGEWKDIGGGRAEVGGEVMEPREFTIQLEPINPKGAAALSSNDALVVLDLNIMPELLAEGYARDLVRMIQQARKDAGLDITDRITLWLDVPDALKVALKPHEAYVAEQTLAAKVDYRAAPKEARYTTRGELAEQKVALGLAVSVAAAG